MELKKGETIMIDAALHLPASFLYKAFSDRSGVPLDFFELYYRGKRLEGEAALASSGIEKGSTIEVKMRGRGGAGNKTGKQSHKPDERPSSSSTPPSSPSQVEAQKKFSQNAKDAGDPAASTPVLALPEHGSTSGAHDANDALGNAFQRPENRPIPSEAMVQAEGTSAGGKGGGGGEKAKPLPREAAKPLSSSKASNAVLGADGRRSKDGGDGGGEPGGGKEAAATKESEEGLTEVKMPGRGGTSNQEGEQGAPPKEPMPSARTWLFKQEKADASKQLEGDGPKSKPDPGPKPEPEPEQVAGSGGPEGGGGGDGTPNADKRTIQASNSLNRSLSNPLS